MINYSLLVAANQRYPDMKLRLFLSDGRIFYGAISRVGKNRIAVEEEFGAVHLINSKDIFAIGDEETISGELNGCVFKTSYPIT